MNTNVRKIPKMSTLGRSYHFNFFNDKIKIVIRYLDTVNIFSINYT